MLASSILFSVFNQHITLACQTLDAMSAQAAIGSSKDILSKCSKWQDRLNTPNKRYKTAENALTKEVCNEPKVPSLQYIILSEFANITLFTSKHGKWEFMHPLLYHSLLFHPQEVAMPRETDIPPKAISPHSNYIRAREWLINIC